MSRRWLAGAATLFAASFVAWAKADRAEDPTAECPTPKGLAALAARLQTRESALERREALLAEKEADLRAAEARLADRLTELESVREAIATQLEQVDGVDAARRDDLVKMLSSMRPKQGAPILSELDAELAVEVLERMSPARAGKLVAALPPAQAAGLLEQLSEPLEVPR